MAYGDRTSTPVEGCRIIIELTPGPFQSADNYYNKSTNLFNKIVTPCDFDVKETKDKLPHLLNSLNLNGNFSIRIEKDRIAGND